MILRISCPCVSADSKEAEARMAGAWRRKKRDCRIQEKYYTGFVCKVGGADSLIAELSLEVCDE